MVTQLLFCTVLSVMAVAWPARAQETPPDSPETKRIETLVNEAADLIEKQGTAVFPEMRKKGSKWYSGELYVFAYDPDLTVILQPAFPEREGENMVGKTDKNGKPFHDELIRVARTKGSGWVDYWVPKPGESEPSQKWGYVKAVNMNGRTGMVGAGFYPK
jgi:signal transduction histidine kinase